MDELPREPMPVSWKPAWKFLGWMVLVVVAMGLIAAAINLLVQH